MALRPPVIISVVSIISVAILACSDNGPGGPRPDAPLVDLPGIGVEAGSLEAGTGAPDGLRGEGFLADAPRTEAGAGPCPPANLPAGNHVRSLSFGGHTRDFDVHVPAGLKAGTAVPLVLDFHGFSSDRVQQKLISGFAKEADGQGFVVVYPNGYGTVRSWNAGANCCGQALAQKLDDVGLAKAIVTDVASVVCIDRKRVYATGISNGGMLSHRLGCEAAPVFAAIAPVAGRIDLKPITSCQPARPTAVIHFHGTNDLLVPYADATASIAHWVQKNGCTDAGTVTFSKGKSSCKTYSSCQAGVKITLCSLDAGHIAYLNPDVPIAQHGWAFMKQFTLP